MNDKDNHHADKIKKRLMNKAIHYLQRYTSSTARLELILCQFARRKLSIYEPQKIQEQIDEVVRFCGEMGYVNDRIFIESKIESSRNKGLSTQQITAKLVQAGISINTAIAAINSYNQQHKHSDNAELEAAFICARKKRIGPYASGQIDTREKTKKEFARLARAGFPIEIVREVMACKSPQEAEIRQAELQEEGLD